MQIRTRLTIQFFLISASLLLMALLAIYFFSAKHQKEEFYHRLKSRANTSADLLLRVDEVDSSLLKLIDINRKDILHYENISVYDSDHKEIYTNNDSLHFHEILSDLDGFLREVEVNGEFTMTDDNLDFVGIIYRNKDRDYLVVACAMDVYGMDNLKNLRKILALVFIVFIVVIGISGWIYSGRALKPISNVIRQVNTISVNSLDQRLEEVHQKDEIYHLVSTFNNMLNRIELAFKTQKTFVSNASHELRNPLTAITSQLEVALIKERNPEEYRKLVASVLEDIKRLNEISHRLLELSKLESDNGFMKMDLIRIDDLIWEVKNDFQVQFPDYKVRLTLHELPEMESQLLISGNRQFLKTAFINLMSNACKFSIDQTVEISIISKQNNWIVRFADQGVGIPPEEISQIFEPFFRGKDASTTKGYGIGLSIVARIMNIHHASISVRSELDKGTEITLIFPRIEF